MRERLAAELVVQGGRMAMDYFDRATISWKGDGSMVTDADLAIELHLTKSIAAAFPEDLVLGEESAREARPTAAARFTWIIDPVDGTNNFGRGLPGFSISIGILEGGMPYAGAVYDPIARWLFTGRRGDGAHLNGRRLQVAGARLSAASLIALRTPLDDQVLSFAEDWLRRYRVRRFGSTALHLCYAAMGALDLVHDDRATLWDVAGAAPIVLEAGAALTRADGGPLFPMSLQHPAGGRIALVAGNPVSHAQAVADIAAAATLA